MPTLKPPAPDAVTVQRVCPGCSKLTTNRGLCDQCTREREQRRNQRRRQGGHTSPEWQALSHATLRDWRAIHGDWCPGDQHHEAHATADLTVDHVVPVSQGGGLLDRANLRVVCRSYNSKR